MNQPKNLTNIILMGAIIIALVVVGFYVLVNQAGHYPTINPLPNPTSCTEEAKQCPDGTYVGRTGPNCEFAACNETTKPPVACEYPAPPENCEYIKGQNYNPQTSCGLILSCTNSNPGQKQVFLQESQREGSLLVQKIYPDRITGLNFREYPVAMGNGEPITLYLGETVSNGCTITLTLIAINGKIATFNQTTDFNKPCPICLAQDTLIDTPRGNIKIQELKVGMMIWTMDKLGNKVAAPIIKTSRTPVPITHKMIRVILEDTREILASPLHPLIDGRTFNDLLKGDILDGSKIMVIEKVSYDKGYTYDILPSGDTGFYIANSILIDSTLH